MRAQCPLKCISLPGIRTVVRFGGFYRNSDRKWIQRYKCARCGKHFSQATHQATFGQKKRQINRKVFSLFASNVSQRRIAKILNVHLTTVSRKLEFLGQEARVWNYKNRHKKQLVTEVQFDPLFSLNHTCAMLRANVNRLIRRTWCTTKKLQPLIDHLEIYTKYHNQILLKI